MKVAIKKGSTSVILHIFINDSSSITGEGLTGLVYNSVGLSAYYMRPGEVNPTQVSLVNITTLGTYVSGGFKEIDQASFTGFYELHLPDACFASGARSCTVKLQGATDMMELPIEIELVDNEVVDVYNLLNGARTELTAIPDTTSSIVDKQDFLFEYFRNAREITATSEKLFKEDGVTQLGATRTISNDGSTLDVGELNNG